MKTVVKNRLIKLDNYCAFFEYDGNTYSVPRKDFEDEFGVYWFLGDLYNLLINAVSKKPSWLCKYKTK